MKSEKIFIKPGTFSLAGTPVERHLQELDGHIAVLQDLLGEKLKATLADLQTSAQDDALTLVTFTGAFTGVSTLLTFCSFIRGLTGLEKGMETPADQDLVGAMRRLLVPIVTSQTELLKASLAAHPGRSLALVAWYRQAGAAILAIQGFISRLG
jgi:hypothetical protein